MSACDNSKVASTYTAASPNLTKMLLKLNSSFLHSAVYYLLISMMVNANTMKTDDMSNEAFSSSTSCEDVVRDRDHIFFKYEDLKVGAKLRVHFGGPFDTQIPRFLPKEQADSIPFSTQKLPFLLNYFGFAPDSPQANAMEYSLNMCEKKHPGDTKRCVTSFESMLDFVRETIHSHDNNVDNGNNNNNNNDNDDGYFKVLSTSPHPKSAKLFQNYTVVKQPRRVPSPTMVACHMMVYPYAVFHCHYPDFENRVFIISLEGEDGTYVDAVATCHMNSSSFNPNHIVFRLLKYKPGLGPVCHIHPSCDLVWVPATVEDSKENYGNNVFTM